MSQTNVVTGGPARFCSACGGALPGPVPRCPRCGAVIAGPPRSRTGVIVIVIVAVAVLGAIPCLGILAAVAIPNYIRYQLRAKEAMVRAELVGLVQAEETRALERGTYAPLGPLPSTRPGSQKAALSPAELKAATDLGWTVQPTTYGRFGVAVSADGRAAALCAESDLDGDGVPAVHVAFLAVGGGDPPPAPCAEPVPHDGRSQPGEVVTVSGPTVF